MQGADPLLALHTGAPEGPAGRPLPDWSGWQDGVVTAVLGGATGPAVGAAPDSSEWLRSYVPIPEAGWGMVVQRVRPSSVRKEDISVNTSIPVSNRILPFHGSFFSNWRRISQ